MGGTVNQIHQSFNEISEIFTSRYIPNFEGNFVVVLVGSEVGLLSLRMNVHRNDSWLEV